MGATLTINKSGIAYAEQEVAVLLVGAGLQVELAVAMERGHPALFNDVGKPARVASGTEARMSVPNRGTILSITTRNLGNSHLWREDYPGKHSVIFVLDSSQKSFLDLFWKVSSDTDLLKSRCRFWLVVLCSVHDDVHSSPVLNCINGNPRVATNTFIVTKETGDGMEDLLTAVCSRRPRSFSDSSTQSLSDLGDFSPPTSARKVSDAACTKFEI